MKIRKPQIYTNHTEYYLSNLCKSVANSVNYMHLNLIVIRSSQIHQLAEFYQSLGLSFDYHQHGKGALHYAAQIGELTFEIYPLLKNQTRADSSLRLGFQVENLDKLIQILQDKNITITQLPKQQPWGYAAVIKDLDGRKIELVEG